MRRIGILPIGGVLLLLPTMVQAHPGIHAAAGFAGGFSHPFSGLDHLIAMIMVGLWAVQLGGRAIWVLPTSFVAMMALGATVAMIGFPGNYAELGIAISIIVLGAALAASVHMPLALAMLVVAVFGLFHGHAHGSEMPETAAAALYCAGFATATTLLHLIGIGIGLAIRRRAVVRSLGVGAAIAGLALLGSAVRRHLLMLLRSPASFLLVVDIQTKLVPAVRAPASQAGRLSVRPCAMAGA